MTGRDYTPYAQRCVCCGRSNAVQYLGEHCAKCVAQAEGDTRGCAVCAVVGTDTHRKTTVMGGM